MDAAKECLNGVMWKYSSQAYYLDRIERTRITKKAAREPGQNVGRIRSVYSL